MGRGGGYWQLPAVSLKSKVLPGALYRIRCRALANVKHMVPNQPQDVLIRVATVTNDWQVTEGGVQSLHSAFEPYTQGLENRLQSMAAKRKKKKKEKEKKKAPHSNN